MFSPTTRKEEDGGRFRRRPAYALPAMSKPFSPSPWPEGRAARGFNVELPLVPTHNTFWLYLYGEDDRRRDLRSLFSQEAKRLLVDVNMEV